MNRALKLTAKADKLYRYMSTNASKDGSIVIRQRDIEQVLNCTHFCVKFTLERLVDLGKIQIQPRAAMMNDRRCNRYRILGL